MGSRRSTFDPRSLLDAVDTQRRAQGLSWAELSRRIGVSVSMMKGMPTRAEIEADSVLQLTQWLGRPVESFCGDQNSQSASHVAASGILRVDTKALFTALDRTRQDRKLDWADVAAQIPMIEVTPAMLSSLGSAKRIGLYRLLAICQWLDAPVAAFTRLSHL